MYDVSKLAKSLVNVMDDNNSYNTLEDAFTMGKITSVAPLIIKVQNLPLYEEDLIIPYYLNAYTDQVNITTSTNDNHNHNISSIHHPSKFELNRIVCLYGIEPDSKNKHGSYQRYVVLGVL